MQVIVAHGSGGGLGMLAFVPVGLLLLIGLVLVFSPVVSQAGQPVSKEYEDDLADRMLGEEEARELRRRARRKRAVRRRAGLSGRWGPGRGGGRGGGHHTWH